MIDEIKNADNDIDKYKLPFTGSNRQKFSSKIFRMLLNFLSAIYNGATSLKEAEFPQKDLCNEINELKYEYKPKNVKEKVETDKVLMHVNDMLKYRDKIIEAFRNGTSLSEHLKKSDNSAYVYVLKNVNNFIQKIKAMEEKINLRLFEDCFESSSPADCARMLINTKNPNENKKFVAEIEDTISDLKDRIKQMSEEEKKNKSANEALKIIKEILDYNENAQKIFFGCIKS